MPAFTFEKLSPRPGSVASIDPVAPIENKPRGMIVQILDRFVDARVRKTLRDERPAIVQRRQK